MKLGICLLGAAVFLSLVGNVRPEQLERSISPSRQFLVYGTDARLRGVISETAESLKSDLLSMLRQTDNWKTPIVIHVQFAQANLPELPRSLLHFSQTGSGLKLQLDLVVDAAVNVPKMQREILGAILLERIYRQQVDIAPGTPYVAPPDWLLEGVLACRSGYDRAPLIDALVSSGSPKTVLPLEDFLRQRLDNLDAPGHLLYRAYSVVLVQLLLEGTPGAPHLAHYIDNLAAGSDGAAADVPKEFPLFSPDDLSKLWQKCVLSLSTARKNELLTFAESNRQLQQALGIEIGDKVYRLEELDVIKSSPAKKAAVLIAHEKLVLLGLTAHPVLRSIVNEYQVVAERILAGKTKRLREHVGRLKAASSKLAARMEAMDDYMNWFEATQSKTRSGLFADYLRTASQQDGARRRRDPVSVYLDAIELQLQK